jgi:hypothetical protein
MALRFDACSTHTEIEHTSFFDLGHAVALSDRIITFQVWFSINLASAPGPDRRFAAVREDGRYPAHRVIPVGVSNEPSRTEAIRTTNEQRSIPHLTRTGHECRPPRLAINIRDARKRTMATCDRSDMTPIQRFLHQHGQLQTISDFGVLSGHSYTRKNLPLCSRNVLSWWHSSDGAIVPRFLTWPANSGLLNPMFKRARSQLAWLMVAVLVCGTGIGAFASVHDQLTTGHFKSIGAAGHSGHDHELDHQHSVVTITDANGACSTVACQPGDHPEEPCCAVHAHCCVSIGFIPAAAGLLLLDHTSLRHSRLAQTFLVGDLLYLVLRPPRQTS